MNCLLCQSTNTHYFTVEKKPVGSYFHCRHCDLIFRDPEERLAAAEEKVRYDLHQNNDSEGYRRFLEPLIQDVQNYATLLRKAPVDLQILDYGCGPTAFLSKILQEKFFRVANYDVFYFTDQNPLQTSYDIITCTEVWEHFYHPLEEITQLTKLLKSSGLLMVMTASHTEPADFQTWHYRRDPTHVIFFSKKTMQWIAERFSLELVKAQSPYWIFQHKA